MRRIKNNFCLFIIILIIQSCSGNAICINTVQKTIISKSGNIISFSIEDSIVVDLTDITRDNNLLENYPGAGIKSFYLQPNMKYVFSNYTDGDAGIGTVNFNTDSLGNLHNLDNRVCE